MSDLGKQLDIFSTTLEKFKFTKPIRLIELFAGYGSQSLALDYLGADYESFRICEWAVNSILAYKELHFPDDKKDYSKNLSDDELKQQLLDYGISADYNKPMTKEQISRKSGEWARKVYNAIKSTHNLVDVSKVTGKSLTMRDRKRVQVMLTYSFPCQDLSLAGKLGGMKEGSGTRSSMIWEVGRILTELKEEKQLPDVLLMENVPQVCGEKNREDFNKWLNFLENLGYQSYYKILSATDYGIPQTRRRCFVISLLGEYYYDFPDGFPLELKLKDMLEDSASDKYYLSEKMIKFFYSNEAKQKEKGNGFRFGVSDGNVIAKTITTGAGHRMDDNYIKVRNVDEKYYLSKKMIDYISETGTKNFINNDCKINLNIARTLTTEQDKRAGTSNYICNELPQESDLSVFRIKEKTKKGYAEAHEGDGVYINRHAQKRGVVQKGKIQTIKTSVDDIGVVVKNKAIKETIEKNELPIGEVRNLDIYNRITSELSQTLTLPNHNSQRLWDGLRIRKLTPRECFRLMGVRDKDYDKLKGKFSDIALYHMAGDSIVVNVLMAIFSQML